MTAHRRLDHVAAITIHVPFATIHHARSTTIDHVHAAHSLNHHPAPTEAWASETQREEQTRERGRRGGRGCDTIEASSVSVFSFRSNRFGVVNCI